MKILALERAVPNVKEEDFAPHLKNEASRVWELQQAGVFRELYFRADRSEAVLMLEADDMASAEIVISTLPLVKAGLIRFELIPLRPYPGFARLFG